MDDECDYTANSFFFSLRLPARTTTRSPAKTVFTERNLSTGRGLRCVKACEGAARRYVR